MATHSGPLSLPATSVLESKALSKDAAHTFLTTYLDRAAHEPGLQPDSTLSGYGPVSANTGAAPNLIIHNLRRIRAGLAGELLGNDLTFSQLSEEGTAADCNIGWQDMGAYEQGQEAIDVAGSDEEQDPTIQPSNEMEVEPYEMESQTKVDKEERKKRKKERRKSEKQSKSRE